MVRWIRRRCHCLLAADEAHATASDHDLKLKLETGVLMSRTVKCGLIQAKNAGPTDAPIEEIKRLNIEKHLKMIDEAAKQGVQILCMQEVFTTPYFCAEQQTRWYEAVEKIPEGPTTKLMQEA